MPSLMLVLQNAAPRLLISLLYCICLTETWLVSDSHSTHSISGYNDINRSREGRQGGSVSVRLRDGISYKVKENMVSS